MATDLDLARAVFPERPWESKIFPESALRCAAWLDRHGVWRRFDPTGAHFSDVLAFLLSRHGWNCVGDDGVYFHMEETGWEKNMIPHDGTAAGIRAAVHRAALRVLK